MCPLHDCASNCEAKIDSSYTGRRSAEDNRTGRDTLEIVSVPSRAPRVKIGAVLARNTLWNYAGFAINMATSFVLFPFVVGHLGEAAAGVWLLLSAVTGYMGLMELGIVPALTQRVAAALGRGDDDAVRRAASTSLALMTVMMLVAAQAAWFAPWVADVLELPPELDRRAATAIAVAIVGVALRMPLAPFQALLLGCQRQDRCSQLWIVMAVVKAVLTAALVVSGYGFVAIVVMEATVHLLAGLLQVRWVRQELPRLPLALSAASWDEVRYLTSFGLQVTVTGMFVLIVEQTDRLVIGTFRPIAEVTLFSAAWKLYALAYTIPTTLVQALTPIVANLHGEGDEDRLRAVFVRMSKYSVAVAFPLIFGIGLAGGWLLDVWMGPRFVGVLPVLQVLLLSLAVTAFNHPGYSVIVGTRRVGQQMWTYNAPLAVLNLGLSVWLVHRLGILGDCARDGDSVAAARVPVPASGHLAGRHVGHRLPPPGGAADAAAGDPQLRAGLRRRGAGAARVAGPAGGHAGVRRGVRCLVLAFGHVARRAVVGAAAVAVDAVAHDRLARGTPPYRVRRCLRAPTSRRSSCAVAAAEADAVALTAPLSDAQANWQPGGGRGWSVVQCLDHLALSNTIYVSHFLPVAERALAAGGPPFTGLRPTWLGRWFVRSLEPPPRHKTKTFKNLVPPSSMPLAAALAAYLASHDPYRRLVTVAGRIDTNRVVTSNPFVRTVRMRLSTALLVVPAHDRRHLWQARQVLAAPGFPRA